MCFSYYGNLHRNFALNINLHHNVIETWGWAHFTQATNQTPRITVKLSSHALATIYSTLATDPIDCYYKGQMDIFRSQCHRNMGVG